MTDIGSWLERHGLGKYTELFLENELTFTVLPELTEDDLRELGLPMGPRKQLLKLVRELGSPDEGPDNSAPRLPATDASSRSGAAERRQLTVMFCDLVGSVELGERMDVEDYRDLLARFRNAMVGAVERSDGFVARHQGDGLLVYFGYPQARENDAERAVRAGLDIVQAVENLEHPYAVTAAVRIGVATGAAVVGDLLETGGSNELAALGRTPNLAARLQGEAEPNSIVVAETTQALTTGLFEFEALPPRALKGISDAVTPYWVRTEVRGESRFSARSSTDLSPFVGREEELELLTRRWPRVKKGRGQVVLTVGEAGIGKSRLLHQLREHIGTQPHEVISLQCSPYHESSALYPVIAAFERMLGFVAATEGAERLEALRHHLKEMGETDEQTLGLLAHLMSIPIEGRFPSVEVMDAAQRRERTLGLLVDYVAKRAERSPLLFAFEDAHWADPTTRELLGRLVEGIEAESALLIATTRPGFEAAWTDLAHVQIISLSRLGPEDGERLAQAIAAGITGLPNDVVQAVISRAEGNPLFIEELTRTVAQSADSVAPNRVIPATLQDSLMARLDASETGKAVAQCAAVIGRDFKEALLAEVWEGSPERLSEGLDALDASGLISQRGEGPLAHYVFKHALVRDTAYGSLLREPRARLHNAVATALEALEPNIRIQAPEVLAQHFTEAGLADQAIDLWLAAVERANARSACEECLVHVATALPLLKQLPVGEARSLKEVDLQLARALAVRALRGDTAKEAGESYTRAREVSEELGDPRRLLTALEGCYRFHVGRSEFPELRATTALVRTIAETNEEPLMRASSYAMLGGDRIMAADYVSARENLERALRACHEAGFETLSAMASPVDIGILRGLTFAYMYLGYFNQALGVAEEGVKLAERRGSRLQVCDARWGLNAALCRRHEYGRLRDEADCLRTIADTNGFPYHLAIGELYSGIALGGLRRLDEAIGKILNAKSKFELLGNPLGLNSVRTSHLAVYLAQTGRFEDAIDFSAEAVSATENTSDWTLTLIRLAEVMSITGDGENAAIVGSAESLFQDAIASARTHKARDWELEAAMGLAKLWNDAGKRQRAFSLVREICDWFTEGHETPVLQEAKAFLDALS